MQASLALPFDELAARDPDRACIAVLGHEWSRSDIQGFASRTARRFLEMGIKPGDRVAIVRRNAALHVFATIAASRVGAVLVPVNFRLPAIEAAKILWDTRPSLVICGPMHADEFDACLSIFPVTTWVVDDMDPSTDPVSDTLSSAWTRFSDLPGGEHDPPVPTPVDIVPDDLAMLLCTSGSTGEPKGVRLSHRNLWASWDNMSRALPLTPDDVSLAIAPFGHAGGLNVFTLQTVLTGGCVIIQRQFDVGEALLHIETGRVNTLFGVPTMFDAMARHPDFESRDISSLRVALVGGAPVSVDLIETYLHRGVPLYNIWGMTETSGAGTAVAPTEVRRHLGSAGRALPNTELRIVDPGGRDVPDGQVGEILVRGGNVTDGYWGQPSTPDRGFLPGGWLRTGDLAVRDAEGYVTISGRSKDMIISGGDNIYPAEIEGELRAHPDVADAAVVGVADAQWGETPLAFVVMKGGRRAISLAAARGFLTGRLARYKLPRDLVVLPELPLGPTGKVDKGTLRTLALQHHDPGQPWYAGENQRS